MVSVDGVDFFKAAGLVDSLRNNTERYENHCDALNHIGRNCGFQISLLQTERRKMNELHWTWEYYY